MNTHWALALVKGNREPHEAKKASFDLGGNRTYDLRSSTQMLKGLNSVILRRFTRPHSFVVKIYHSNKCNRNLKYATGTH